MLLASFTSDLYEMGTFSRAPGRGGGGQEAGCALIKLCSQKHAVIVQTSSESLEVLISDEFVVDRRETECCGTRSEEG